MDSGFPASITTPEAVSVRASFWKDSMADCIEDRSDKPSREAYAEGLSDKVRLDSVLRGSLIEASGLVRALIGTGPAFTILEDRIVMAVLAVREGRP
jgi:hypothetical protein